MSSIVKVIEVIAQSEKSWEDAAANAVREASKSVDNIKSIYIKEKSAKVKNGKIVLYRVDTNISFVIGKKKKKEKSKKQ